MKDGHASYQGRLEIKYDGEWGTVCNESFNQNALKVACKQLGLPSFQKISSSFPIGPAGGRIWLENVQCNGNEDSIFDCSHSGWGNTSCTHDYDIGIICSRELMLNLLIESYSTQV